MTLSVCSGHVNQHLVESFGVVFNGVVEVVNVDPPDQGVEISGAEVQVVLAVPWAFGLWVPVLSPGMTSFYL